jgi:hypothetical protein
MRIEKAREEFNALFRVTEARYKERCKSAGVKIHRTAENVEGLFLMRLRTKEELSKRLRPKTPWDPKKSIDTDHNTVQFLLNDPYGRDLDDEWYIGTFLGGRNAKGHVLEKLHGPDIVSRGYRYVELTHPVTGERMRYEGRMLTGKEVIARSRRDWETAPCGDPAPDNEAYPGLQSCPVPITGPAPRYGVTYDDISTEEDREYWIAGSSLRVIDLQTGKVMAERVSYMMDTALGRGWGGSSPWKYAVFCPDFPKGKSYMPAVLLQSGQTRRFVELVLKPKQTH